MDLSQPLDHYTYVAFDTETSGAYPIGYDIVEFGAIKWRQGKEVDRIQTLLKPREPMSDFIIGIHGISNEMVAEAPPISAEIRRIHEFFKDSVALAHHAPFDLGFVALEFEKASLPLPTTPVLCTSLLSRRWIPETENHKLQTLVKHFGFDGGAAHRAFDDAKSCLMVGLECFKRLGAVSLDEALKSQGKNLSWAEYSILGAHHGVMRVLREAIEQKKNIEMVYDGGSKKGEVRPIKPIGVVRNPDGDYLMGLCLTDNTNKRYYLSRIKDVAITY